MDIRINHIIARVLSGDSSSEDILQLSNWLNKEEKNKKEFSYLKNYWDAEVASNHFSDPAITFDKLQEQLNREKKQMALKQRWRLWTPIAASIAVLLAVSSWFIFQSAEEQVTFCFTYLTENNKAEFNLEDGTTVTLNKNSRLSYTNFYGKEERVVVLEGEAFFDVKKDSVKPFIVSVANDRMRVKVLGTRFNVNAYPSESDIHTTLVEGAVLLQFTDAEKRMSERLLDSPLNNAVYNLTSKNVIVGEQKLVPAEKLTFNILSKKIETSHIDPIDEYAWKDGLIKYKNVSFSDLISELEKKFKVKITIENETLAQASTKVTGTFTEEQSLEQILEVVARSLPIQWSNGGDTYSIK